MTLNKFIQQKQTCPICAEPLQLYMQFVNSRCFRAKEIDNSVYRFDPFVVGDVSNSNKNEHFFVSGETGDYQIIYKDNPPPDLENHAVFFFYLCNPAGFNKKSKGYEINAYKGCYYRSTPYLEIKKDGKLEFTVEKEIDSKDEVFCLRDRLSNSERVFIFSLAHAANKTKLWYYSVTEEDRKQKGFKPKLFSKELPLVRSEIKVLTKEEKVKMIERLDGWILMS
jgi:hypothetical protein